MTPGRDGIATLECQHCFLEIEEQKKSKCPECGKTETWDWYHEPCLAAHLEEFHGSEPWIPDSEEDTPKKKRVHKKDSPEKE